MTLPAVDVPARSPAAVLHAAGEVRLEERPTPRPGPREVLVEVRAVGVCGSDVHYYRDGRIGSYVVDAPLVLGHEASGVVVGLGDAARRHAVGQRVALEPGVPCGHCRPCRTGHYNLCPDVRFFATPPVDGAFARYVTIDEDFAHPLPDALSDDAGALLEPLSVGVWAAWKGRVRAGDRVLVTGAGPIGLLCAAVARASGASEVVVSDVQAVRRTLAGPFGATATLDAAAGSPAEQGIEADVLLECSGAAAAVDGGLAALRPGGRAVLVGMAADATMPLPTQLLQTREIELTGTFRYAHTYPTAIALATSGAVDLDALVTGHYPLADAEAALTAAARDPAAVKPVVVPSQG